MRQKHALTQGVGDLIAYGVVVTPEREKKVAFSIPIATNIKQIVVTGKGFGQATSLQDLSGKKIYVNPLSTYYDNLQKLNVSLRKQGKPPILVEKADANLGDEDLLEMVNAGIIPATVTITERANSLGQCVAEHHGSSGPGDRQPAGPGVGDAKKQS